jgi:hypothetical protein
LRRALTEEDTCGDERRDDDRTSENENEQRRNQCADRGRDEPKTPITRCDRHAFDELAQTEKRNVRRSE